MGLVRCKAVAEKMQLLNPKHIVISVSGTNGKGSSVTMLDNILRYAGYRTGSYTSPHLIRYNERIRLTGTAVSDEQLCRSFQRIDQIRGDISLTYFEFGTLAALDIFQHAELDVCLLEIGLGGRLDAVNCLDANIALISSIDIDHERWLGADRESIGHEKAGIFRTSSPAVCSDPNPPQSIFKYAEQLKTDLYVLKDNFSFHLGADDWSWKSGPIVYTQLPKPNHYSDCQVQNAAGVLMALTLLSDKLPVDAQAIKQGLRDFDLAGRFQILFGKTQIILDVAHNPEAIRNLVYNLEQLPVAGKTHIVIGIFRDKDHRTILRTLAEVVDIWHTVKVDGQRGTDSETLANELLEFQPCREISQHQNITDALEYITSIVGKNDRIVITGSFLFVGTALKRLNMQVT